MHQIYTYIKQTYLDRSGNHELQKELWQDVITCFPAMLDPQGNERFSYNCSSQAGDTGLAMLWIVQTALVQGIIHDALEDLNMQSGPARGLRALPRQAIGALAHNDDHKNPVILDTGSEPKISGKKNYITGGTTTDFILLTARTSPDEKTSSLILLKRQDLPYNSLDELHLGALATVSHARLTLDHVPVPADSIIPVDPARLRRSIKRWSILERSLILEAVLGLVKHLYNMLNTLQLNPDFSLEEISSLINDQQKLINRQIIAARKNEKIEESLIDIKSLQHMIDALERTSSAYEAVLSADQGHRFKDLFFLKRLMFRG